MNQFRFILNSIQLMKRITILTGAIFTGITVISILFKVLHWKGANFGLLIGLSGIALIFVPLMAGLLLRKPKEA